MFTNRKEDFQNKIRTQISTCRHQLKQKDTFLGTQVNTLKSKYLKSSSDFAKTFDIIVSANVYIKGANDLLSDLTILQQNAELLFDKATLPSQIQIALEKSYAVAKINKQKDLFNLLTPIVRIHHCMTDIAASHESLVYLGIDPINEKDVQEFYPKIKSQCQFEENQYVRESLAKYSFVLQPQFSFNPPNQNFYPPQNMQPQLYQQGSNPQTFPQNGFSGLPPQQFPQNGFSGLPPQQFAQNGLPPQYNNSPNFSPYSSTNLQPQYNNLQYGQQPPTYQNKNDNVDGEMTDDMFLSVHPIPK